jgi:hypothetical protein
MGGRNDCWWAMLLGDAGSNLRPCCVKVSGHRWLCWLPRDSADTWGYGRWRCWLRTARCDGGVARLLHAEDHLPPRVTGRPQMSRPVMTTTLKPLVGRREQAIFRLRLTSAADSARSWPDDRRRGLRRRVWERPRHGPPRPPAARSDRPPRSPSVSCCAPGRETGCGHSS